MTITGASDPTTTPGHQVSSSRGVKTAEGQGVEAPANPRRALRVAGQNLLHHEVSWPESNDSRPDAARLPTLSRRAFWREPAPDPQEGPTGTRTWRTGQPSRLKVARVALAVVRRSRTSACGQGHSARSPCPVTGDRRRTIADLGRPPCRCETPDPYAPRAVPTAERSAWYSGLGRRLIAVSGLPRTVPGVATWGGTD